MTRRTCTRIAASALALAAFVTTAGPAGASPKDVATVEIEGSAAGTNANAMEEARMDALRKAVSRVCGEFISSQTKVKNYEAVYDKTMALTVGYVTESDVLGRRVVDGVSYCKVRATVSKARFEKEWARLLHTIEAEDNPRCVVVVIEDSNLDDNVPPKANGVVQSVLENFFLEKGLQIMDQGASDKVRERDIALAAINDDINKLAAVAASFKADVVIRGVAEARLAGSSEMGGRTVHRWTATITIRAYHTDSAQMLMSNRYSASKATVHGNAGGDEVLRECADKNAGRILEDIGGAWRKRQNVRRTVQVTLHNCGRKDFKAFQAAATQIKGVQKVRLKELVNNVCQIEIDWAYDVERLVTRIEELKVEGTAYEITEQTHDRVMIKLVK